MAEGLGSNTASTSGSKDGLEWQFLQCFGERTPGEEIQDADVISTVEFDHTGHHLATGDRGGRVVLFERITAPPKPVGMEQRSPPHRLANLEYRYLTEFQSHEPEFDYLKSLEIEEKINQVRWVNHNCAARMLLSTNDKTVKLWKVYEKRVENVAEFNMPVSQLAQAHPPQGSWSIPATGDFYLPAEADNFQMLGASASITLSPSKSKLADITAQKLNIPLRLPKVVSREYVLSARCRRTYANAHTYHINSISMASDQETFLSADDLRINLWHLDVSAQSFNILDIKPANMEELTEVITCAEFHPSSCSVFAYSSSKGGIRMGDMRSNALCDRHAKSFDTVEPPGQKSFFSEIISSISDMRFSKDGRYMLSRDFMSLKLWDVNKESEPVAVYNVHEGLRGKLCDLYENDCIFDKFDCCMSGSGEHVATGTYTNYFRILQCAPTSSPEKAETLLEASRDPLRKRLQTPKMASRFGLTRNSAKRAASGGMANGMGDSDPTAGDFNAKLLHLAWHPEENVIAAAASNSLYMYCAR